MTEPVNKIAKLIKMDKISSVWIIPVVALVIGAWILYTHVANQGLEFTLLTKDASGIVAGKTVIKNRSVDVGVVKTVTFSDDFKSVVVKGTINKEMAPLLKNDSLFWIVKPQIGREGVSGLGTLLSGVYIELSQGSGNVDYNYQPFTLHDTPPISSANEKGLRINLTSDQSGIISAGAPVLFRGVKVGSIEKSEFDQTAKMTRYQVFIAHPYEVLVTQNVRFWREGGIDFELSARGASLDIPSLDVLFAGGMSFDTPKGASAGEQAQENASYTLYANQKDIQDSQYTDYQELLLFFTDSISGLSEGAAVEYRGIRIGTVSKVPFFSDDTLIISAAEHTIPVLIRIEPGRLAELGSAHSDKLFKDILFEQRNGLRAALKSANFFTGASYVDLDFYPDEIVKESHTATPGKQYNYYTLATVSAGLSQIQAKIVQTLDNINKLPIDRTVKELNNVLQNSEKLTYSLNQLVSNKAAQNLPTDLQNMMKSLNETLKGLQPGSDLHKQLRSDLQKFEQVMDELGPLLNTLNDKSNALIFAAPGQKDPEPKAKENR